MLKDFRIMTSRNGPIIWHSKPNYANQLAIKLKKYPEELHSLLYRSTEEYKINMAILNFGTLETSYVADCIKFKAVQEQCRK